MKQIQEHVEWLFRDVPDGERKSQLMQEIEQNLEEKVKDLRTQGKSEEDALNKAFVDFGDIDEIKAELKTGRRGNDGSLALGFSIWGSVLIIALVVFINFYYTPHVIWFVYPTFGVLWWPLALFFHWLKKRGELRDGD
ncbi:MAG TPA: permease prefix domain 1-containing protein [Clostridia bacterium]|nr:permease prefix domain 1-containing protein [Clostridia bacterium]